MTVVLVVLGYAAAVLVILAALVDMVVDMVRHCRGAVGRSGHVR